MSLRLDGRYRCDRCGRELENGGAQECDPHTHMDESGSISVFHFCKASGCDRKVLSSRNLADYNESRTT